MFENSENEKLVNQLKNFYECWSENVCKADWFVKFLVACSDAELS